MSENLKTDSKALQIAAWAVSVPACLYFIWTYIQQSRAITVFGDMYAGMGVELPASTRFLLAYHFVLYPVLFVGAAVLVVAKEVSIQDKKLSVATTFFIALVVLCAVNWINGALYAPLLSLVEKLSK